MNEKPEPIYCGATIEGPKVGYRVVAWRKRCRQRVKKQGDRCRFHDGSGTFVGVPAEYQPKRGGSV